VEGIDENGAMDAPDSAWVTGALSEITGHRVEMVEPLAGGASRMSFTALVDGQRCVVQVERGDTGRDMLAEYELLRHLSGRGLPLARPIVAGRVDGRALMALEFVDGETLGRRVVRGLQDGSRRAFIEQFATVAARIHRCDPTVLGTEARSVDDPIDQYAEVRATLAADRPVLALAERWLRANPPTPADPVLCHGDLRVGNLIVDDGSIRAVIDWELAHTGHPAEDLGWACVRAWRFGGVEPALGCGSREELLDAYSSAGGARIDLETLIHHEVLGTWKWALMCLLQAEAHLSGVVDDLEMLAIGRRVVENEYDLLRLIGWIPTTRTTAGTQMREPSRGSEVGETGIVPERIHLAEALERERGRFGSLSDYRQRLHRFVSGMVEREDDRAEGLAADRRALRSALAVDSHHALTDEIASGERRLSPELLDLLGGEVLAQLEVVAPGYAGREDDAPPRVPGESTDTD